MPALLGFVPKNPFSRFPGAALFVFLSWRGYANWRESRIEQLERVATPPSA